MRLDMTQTSSLGVALEDLLPAPIRDRHHADADHFLDNPTTRVMGRDRQLAARHKSGRRISSRRFG